MEEEVRKWVKKKLQEAPASGIEEPKPVEVAPIKTAQEKKAEPDVLENIVVEDEIEKSLQPVQEVKPEMEVKPEIKGVEIPQIKENLNIDTDFSKVNEQERPQPLPEEKPGFSTKAKIILILVVLLLAFLSYWFYTFFSVKVA